MILKIVSLNIQYYRHFDRFIPFLKKHKPDVVLLQEVLRKDVCYLEKALGMKGTFTILSRFRLENVLQDFGIATFSTLPIIKHYNLYYRGDGENPPILRDIPPYNTARALLVTEVTKDRNKYCLINTHFTWASEGKPNELQYHDLDILLQMLATIPEFILCGDFNAPRGTPVFNAISTKYKDNIPSHITTTIDKNLHKAGDLQLVVDGLFTTPNYQVESIELVNNLSDHWGILAEISL